METRAIAFLQARMGSSRLPGKIMKKILNREMLSYAIESLKKSDVISLIVILTSTNKENDILENFALKEKVELFRGSEDNVLERFYQASLIFESKYYFRATGDNPLVDPKNPSRSLDFLIKNNLDYCCEKDMPKGSIIEAFTKEALHKAYDLATNQEDKEHVTLIMKRNKSFNSQFFIAPKEYQVKNLSFTIDTIDEFEYMEKIFKKYYNQKKGINFQEVIKELKIKE